MRKGLKLLSLLIVLALTNISLISTAFGQRQYRLTDNQMRQLIQRIDTRTENFRRNLNNTLARNDLNSAAQNEIRRYVADFEAATDRLRTRFNNRQPTGADARAVLDRAAMINNFLLSYRIGPPVEQNWRLLQSNLNQLAQTHNIAFQWGTMPTDTSVGHRLSDTQMQQLVRRIENRSDRFRNSLERALDRGNFRNTATEDEINRQLRDFEFATDQLRDNFDRRQATSIHAQNVLERAALLNQFMARHQLDGSVQSDWNLLRGDLNQLASAYGIAWNWATSPFPGSPAFGSDALLTGTYRLNASQSTNPTLIARNATRNLPATQRQRVYDELITRIDPPNALAIERRGNMIAIASTRAPQINFVADGREHLETTEMGRTARVRATIQEDQLTVVRTGDRAHDFTVTFNPIDNGRRLLVTRNVYVDQLTQPVTVQTYYDRTSDIAQLNLHSTSPEYPTTGTVSGDFVVPDGTVLLATLNSRLSTETAQDQDRFTMTVRSPAQYSGAVIEGYVTDVNRSGKITGRSEMLLNFDQIRLRNGRTYRFAGLIEKIHVPGQENVRVDTEGSVREGDSQTERTVTRTAIGTAVGAVIGAIAGGGKGAAIGAIIGAGAGAGSVYVQGRDDLDLTPGTEVTIRASGPR